MCAGGGVQGLVLSITKSWFPVRNLIDSKHFSQENTGSPIHGTGGLIDQGIITSRGILFFPEDCATHKTHRTINVTERIFLDLWNFHGF